MAKRTRSYVEEAFKLIEKQPDVKDIVILNPSGNPVKSSMNEQDSLQYAGMFDKLMEKAQYAIKQLDPKDDVAFLRVRTKLHETLIAPDEKLTFIVVQNPQDKIDGQ